MTKQRKRRDVLELTEAGRAELEHTVLSGGEGA
jgi:hypothetical protein